ncbi:hypothetical protein D9M68_632220 [compost metagenome]
MAQVARDARLGGRAPAARQRERIAGQVAGFGEPGEAGIQDDQRLAHAAGRQWPGKGAPVRMAARELLAAGQDPARRRLRIGQEARVGQQVLVRERGQRLAQLQDRPQDQPLDLAPVGLEGRRAVGIAREPGGDGGQVVGRGDPRGRGGGAVAAGRAGQRRREPQALERGGERGGQAFQWFDRKQFHERVTTEAHRLASLYQNARHKRSYV